MTVRATWSFTASMTGENSHSPTLEKPPVRFPFAFNEAPRKRRGIGDGPRPDEVVEHDLDSLTEKMEQMRDELMTRWGAVTQPKLVLLQEKSDAFVPQCKSTLQRTFRVPSPSPTLDHLARVQAECIALEKLLCPRGG